MPRYVTLIRFTDQGARAIRKSTARALALKRAAEKAGHHEKSVLDVVRSVAKRRLGLCPRPRPTPTSLAPLGSVS